MSRHSKQKNKKANRMFFSTNEWTIMQIKQIWTNSKTHKRRSDRQLLRDKNQKDKKI
jgi:hypothetical protein